MKLREGYYYQDVPNERRWFYVERYNGAWHYSEADGFNGEIYRETRKPVNAAVIAQLKRM